MAKANYGEDRIKALNNANSFIPAKRAEGIVMLGVFGIEEDLKLIKQGLNDSNEAVKVASLYADTLFGSLDSGKKIVEFLDHSKPYFRKLARIALETVFCQKLTDAAESVDNGIKAKAEWSDWVEKNAENLVWDEKKKVYTSKD